MYASNSDFYGVDRIYLGCYQKKIIDLINPLLSVCILRIRKYEIGICA